METITSFSAEHAFLSNFHPADVILDGDSYPTVEHAYQAAKTDDYAFRLAIRLASGPKEAKRLARKAPLRSDWDKARLEVMLDLLRQKFSQADLQELLLQTRGALLVEGNNWGDRFWGCVFENGRWVGHNQLGRLLMRVRDEIRIR